MGVLGLTTGMGIGMGMVMLLAAMIGWVKDHWHGLGEKYMYVFFPFYYYIRACHRVGLFRVCRRQVSNAEVANLNMIKPHGNHDR